LLGHGRVPASAGRYVAVSAAVSALLLAACSFTGQPTPATPADYARSAPQGSVPAQHLYVANLKSITVYGLDSPSLVRTISKVSPTAIAFDRIGKLYVANAVGGQGQGTVAVYAVGASSPQYVITAGVHYPNAIMLNDSRDLFVSNYFDTDYVYKPGKTATLYTFKNLFSMAFAADTLGNFYVAANEETYGGGGGRVQIRAQSNGRLLYTITSHIEEPEAIALDTSNNLYVANEANVTVYAPGGKTVIRTIKGLTAPHALAFDQAGQLYVADDAANKVTVYATGKRKLVATIKEGVLKPVALAFDAAGNLYVANESSVTEYAPGTLALERTFTKGVSRPVRLAIGP
jgi:hypothetical protein